jgi:hypothetical protein
MTENKEKLLEKLKLLSDVYKAKSGLCLKAIKKIKVNEKNK